MIRGDTIVKEVLAVGVTREEGWSKKSSTIFEFTRNIEDANARNTLRFKFLFYSEIASEIYKGNSKKYKEKYRSEGFFIFYPLQYLYR